MNGEPQARKILCQLYDSTRLPWASGIEKKDNGKYFVNLKYAF